MERIRTLSRPHGRPRVRSGKAARENRSWSDSGERDDIIVPIKLTIWDAKS